MKSDEIIEKEEINPHELRRKILRIAKELFLHPSNSEVAPKSVTPSKKQIISKLTKDEVKYINENYDSVFPIGMPERMFWNSYSGRDMNQRKKILLRIVAEDDAFIIEKKLVQEQFEEGEDRTKTDGKHLPPWQEVLIRLPDDEREILSEVQTPILSTTASLMTLPQRDRLYYFSTGKLPIEKEQDLSEAYSKYISQGKPAFLTSISFINDMLCALKKFDKVKDTTIMSARIKSSDSAKTNDSKKALDDIFGVEVAFSTSDEEREIEQIIASMVNIKKEKHHDKANGYKAYHCCGALSGFSKDFEETKLYEILKEKYSDEKRFNISIFERMISIIGPKWEKYRSDIIRQLIITKENFDKDSNIVIRQEDKLTEQQKQIIERYLKKDPSLTPEEIEHARQEIDLLVSSLMPHMEFQFKTISTAINAIHGPAAHHEYKDGDMVKAENPTPEEKEKRIQEYKEYIQDKYTQIWRLSGGSIPDSIVPSMWKSRLDGETGRNCGVTGFYKLDNMEALQHIYPFFINPEDLGIEPLEKYGHEF